MSLPWPDHMLTLEEWEGLPEHDELRLEVAEGILAMSITIPDAEVLVDRDPLTIRVPDVIVTGTTAYRRNPARFHASEVLLAVEVLSDGTRRVDRVMKFSEYAEAGIPQYWIVDLDEPVTLTAYVLVDGDYELSGELTGDPVLTVAGHPVRIDLAALTPR
ncbi:hypothetical protein BJF78_34900 [Pseudonocardia sp. CNS-139]|nr:hypothetical protein BJF78_34900 [Pseudonocardia sp. CNS-139]